MLTRALRATPQLRDGGVFGGSVTSMAENVARVALRGGSRGGGGAPRAVTLVDLPGHPRLRARLDAYAPAARALVFLVDGRDGAFLPACRETAECVGFAPRSVAAGLRAHSRARARAGCCWTCCRTRRWRAARRRCCSR